MHILIHKLKYIFAQPIELLTGLFYYLLSKIPAPNNKSQRYQIYSASFRLINSDTLDYSKVLDLKIKISYNVKHFHDTDDIFNFYTNRFIISLEDFKNAPVALYSRKTQHIRSYVNDNMRQYPVYM